MKQAIPSTTNRSMPESGVSAASANPLQLLKGRPPAGMTQPVLHNPIQMLKSQMPAQLMRQVAEEEMEHYLQHADRGDSEEEDDTADTVRGNYTASLDVGRGLMTSGLAWFTGNPEKPPVSNVKTEEEIQARGYQDEYSFTGSEVLMGTDRVGPGNATPPIDKQGGMVSDEHHYRNYFNVSTGEFKADMNYRNEDTAVAEENGFNAGTERQNGIRNSEMIWHQILLARSKAPGKGIDQLTKLKSITRGGVQNTQTLDTMFMCRDGGQRLIDNAPVVFDEPDDDVMALLGTPNGRSAVVLLLEHGSAEGLTDIESVTMTKTDLTIKYM